MVAIAVASLILLAGCAAPGTTLVPLDQERLFLPDTVAAHAPVDWTLYATKLELAIPGGAQIFLANQPFPDPCAGSTQEHIECLEFPPPVKLQLGGVVVGFDYAKELLGGANPEPNGPGEVVTLNGFRTKVVRETPGACASLGADETVTILIPSLADWTGRTTVEACLRGPDLAENEAKLLAMVEAATAK